MALTAVASCMLTRHPASPCLPPFLFSACLPALLQPKDIVTKMRVQGLTLAHVKSHLQKHRAQQGVAYVQHSTRATASLPTRRAQQQRLEQKHTHSNGHLGGHSGSGGGSSDSEGAPPAKHPRASSQEAEGVARAAAPHASSLPPFAATPADVGSGDGGSSDWPRFPPLIASKPVMLPAVPAGAAGPAPFQHYLSALGSAAQSVQPPQLQPLLPQAPPRQPLAATVAREAPPATDKLRAFADLAIAQHEELEAQALPLEHHASVLAELQGRLEAATPLWQLQPPQPSAAPQQRLLHSQLDGLLEQQRRIQQQMQQHLLQQGALLAELAAFRRAQRGC